MGLPAYLRQESSLEDIRPHLPYHLPLEVRIEDLCTVTKAHSTPL